MSLINKHLKLITCILFLASAPALCGDGPGSYADIISSKVICKQTGKYIGWPSITQTRSGELLVVFSGMRDAHVCPFGIVQMISSTDQGQTWTDPVTINNTPLDDRDAGILETGQGTLLVNWFTSLAFDTEKQYERNPTWRRHAEKLGKETRKYWLGNWTRRSADGGQSWEEPVKQLVSAPHGPIELSDGRLLYVGTARPEGKKIIGVEQSLDDGRSWQLISSIPMNSEDDIAFIHEPHVVELSDGKLVVMLRYSPGDLNQRYLRQSESYDGGRTWTTSHPTDIWGYPPHLLELKSGLLLVSYGVRKEPFGEKACISRDGGETWETDREIMINPAMNGDLGYPASVQLEDGSILTVYYQIDKEGEKTCLMSTHWRLKEEEFPVLPRVSPPEAVTRAGEDKIVNIGSRLELFLDTFLIEKRDGVLLRMHEPVDAGKVLAFDKSWEGPFCGYCTVIKDQDKYRLYYRGIPRAGRDGSSSEVSCYAESDDGVSWTRPDLGFYEVSGTKLNNVIMADAAPVTHNFSPFLDTRKGIDPEHRYKALGGLGGSGLMAYVSKDGIHWKALQKDPVITGKESDFDSQNIAFWSEEEQLYLCYYRTWVSSHDRRYRSVARTTSTDFIHWTDPVEMDFGPTPREQLYTNQTSPYFRAPHIYVSVAARFMPSRQVVSEEEAKELQVNPKYYRDCSDAVFFTTRGGNRYDRTFMESIIRPGIGLQNWVSRSNYPALNVVQTAPAEMSIYVNQDYAQPSAHLRRYTLRLDGFASAHASFDEGELITRPFRFNGDRLWLNFSSSAAGYIKVEILDIHGNSLEGFELDKSREMIGNEIEKAVSWKGDPDLEKIMDRPVRLRFVMKDADLYSLRFN